MKKFYCDNGIVSICCILAGALLVLCNIPLSLWLIFIGILLIVIGACIRK